MEADEANAPLARHVHWTCYDTLPWLISFSLGASMPSDSAIDISRRKIAAGALRSGGILLWIAAAIHFFALPLLRGAVAPSLPGDAYNFVWPILAFAFSLNGVLLLPLGFTAIYCAAGIVRGEPWARTLGLICALTVLVLPPLLVIVMGFRYFSAKPFLAAAIIITVAGLSMTVPLLRLTPMRGVKCGKFVRS